MASLQQIEQYLAQNPELAARIKQQIEETMKSMMSSGNPAAASSAAILRAQELMMSMMSQQSMAALTQMQQPNRNQDRQSGQSQRSNLNSAHNSSATAVRDLGPSSLPMTTSQISQSQHMAAQQITDNSIAGPLGNGTYLATSTHVIQSMAAGAPPTLVVPETMIPLYPGYPQVPGGPGFVSDPKMTKYAQLLAVIEEMSKDLRPTYSGSKTAQEHFKRGINQARILIRECINEMNQISAKSN